MSFLCVVFFVLVAAVAGTRIGHAIKIKEANQKSKYENENCKMWIIIIFSLYVHRNLHKTEHDHVISISDIFDSRHYQRWKCTSILSKNKLWSGSSGSSKLQRTSSAIFRTRKAKWPNVKKDQLKKNVIIHINIFRLKSSIHSGNGVSCSSVLVC